MNYSIINGLAALLMLPLANTNAQENTKPNILVLIADDLGMDLGCYGNEAIKTPNIDKLASLGVRFENAYGIAPQCSPSRTGMLSGCFAHTIGTEDLHTGINDTTRLLPSYLKEAGYFTGLILKGHLGNNGMRQFDWHDPAARHYSTNPNIWEDSLAINFSKFIEQSGDGPFFMWTGFIDPHRGYNDHPIDKIHKAEDVIVPPMLVNDEPTRRDLADYYDEVARMDRHIGQMIEVLEKSGRLKNTIIIFLSDNGMPFPRCKGTLYDIGIKTPLIAVWPGRIPQAKVHANGLISTIDLAPTFLELAGIEKPVFMFGSSILPQMKDPSKPGREIIFAERNWHDADEYMRCLRTEKYKFIINLYPELLHGTPSDLSSSPSWFSLRRNLKEGKLDRAQSMLFDCPRAAIELYDMQSDPWETRNLAQEEGYKELIGDFGRKLKHWQQTTADHPSYLRRMTDETDRVTGYPLPMPSERIPDGIIPSSF